MNMGFFWGMLSSCSFGLIPFFSLPVLQEGMAPATVLFYRFLFASISLAFVLIVRGRPLLVCVSDALKIGGFCFFYVSAAVLMMVAFLYMDSGLVATLLFSYPIFVVVLMTLFFHEKACWSTALALCMALGGVVLLVLPHGEVQLSAVGIALSLLSAVLNAGYIASIQVVRLRVSSGLTVTFYIMLFSALYMGVFSLVQGTLTAPAVPMSWINLMLLAVVTAVISNVALVLSIRYIGATYTSVLGALEPLTAVAIGITFFNEAITTQIVCAIVLIVGAVMVIMLVPHLKKRGNCAR